MIEQHVVRTSDHKSSFILADFVQAEDGWRYTVTRLHPPLRMIKMSSVQLLTGLTKLEKRDVKLSLKMPTQT